MSDDEQKEYRWETGYEKTWELFSLDSVEDEHGNLVKNISELMRKSKQKRLQQKSERNRLGLMRQLFILVDCSEAMGIADFKPTRIGSTLKHLDTFVQEFVTANPISQMGIIGLIGKRAEKLSDLTGSCKQHIQALDRMKKLIMRGEVSILNGLSLALGSLRATPAHVSREILIIMGALGTCDPGDINDTIKILVEEGIRVSVISLSAEIYICTKLAKSTKGTFSAVLNDEHFRTQLMEHLEPPVAAEQQENSLVKMGFPHGKTMSDRKHPSISICMCHPEVKNDPSKLTGGYHCPQCLSKYCELPTECITCGLMLVTAPHLARSYHHLFPVPAFTEVPYNGQVAVCYACQLELSMSNTKNIYRCEICKKFFCSGCDSFIHDTLHSCVGCNTIPGIKQPMFNQGAAATTTDNHQENTNNAQHQQQNGDTAPKQRQGKPNNGNSNNNSALYKNNNNNNNQRT